MIAFVRRSVFESIKRLWPAYRKAKDAELREAIRYLVLHPEAPCDVDGQVIANGYGRPENVWTIPPVDDGRTYGGVPDVLRFL